MCFCLYESDVAHITGKGGSGHRLRTCPLRLHHRCRWSNIVYPGDLAKEDAVPPVGIPKTSRMKAHSQRYSSIAHPSQNRDLQSYNRQWLHCAGSSRRLQVCNSAPLRQVTKGPLWHGGSLAAKRCKSIPPVCVALLIAKQTRQYSIKTCACLELGRCVDPVEVWR